MIMFISMIDTQYWKSNNVCNTRKIKKKLKIFVSFNIVDLLHFSLEFLDPPIKINSPPKSKVSDTPQEIYF